MNDLSALDKKNIWHPFTPLTGVSDPLLIESAAGIYLHASGGRKIIDAISSWWVNLHGHSHPLIAEAIAAQAKKLEHVIFAGFTHEPAIRLSKNLLSILPSNQSRIFFSDNGSTAVEVALKMAIQYWFHKGNPRNKIIAIQGAYHGDTFGAMAVGARGLFTDPFRPLLFEVEFVDFPEKQNEAVTLQRFRELVQRDDVAAFIYEPLVQAAGGMRMYDPAFLDSLLDEAHNHSVVCIADEVFTGFGRTGKNFASDHCRRKPDIMAVSKGITGGALPLGVTSCTDEIQSAFATSDLKKTFFHGHSYTANPLACAAANASFDLLMDQACVANIERIGRSHEYFKNKLNDHPAVKEVRTLGTIFAIELKTGEESSYVNNLRNRIYDFFLSRDILLRPLGNVIYILPPYIITDDELNRVYAAIRDFLAALQND
jgi:adenosylmethionine-8-amino-7-oxononanoate aminotransferase